jgi:hypothetical protein
MSLESKVKTLEDNIGMGDDDVCVCRYHRFEVRRYTAPGGRNKAESDETPGKICLVCGKQKCILKLVRAERPKPREVRLCEARLKG